MVKMILVALLTATGLSLFSQNLDGLTFGTDSTLEVMTWNIERFPKNGQTTLIYVTEIIEDLDVDVVALQEIDSKVSFEYLVDGLDGWEGFYADAEFAPLAYIYKPDVIEVISTFQIFTNLSREFPRPPFIMELMYGGELFIIINNHFKCCGDGDLESGDAWDEETRRLHASNLLEGYIISNYPDEKVIMLGDLNDLITDNADNNVFRAFTDRPDDYAFTDIDIAEGDYTGWSFPNWPSHLDHILVTNELFEGFENHSSDIQTIKIDEFLDGGFDEYDDNVSDHRPVAIKIDIGSDIVNTADMAGDKCQIYGFPSPFRDAITITFDHVFAPAKIEIYNAVGLKVGDFNLGFTNNSLVWEPTGLSAGVYYAVLLVDNELASITMLLMVD